jgi:hypothetical protein
VTRHNAPALNRIIGPEVHKLPKPVPHQPGAGPLAVPGVGVWANNGGDDGDGGIVHRHHSRWGSLPATPWVGFGQFRHVQQTRPHQPNAVTRHNATALNRIIDPEVHKLPKPVPHRPGAGPLAVPGVGVWANNDGDSGIVHRHLRRWGRLPATPRFGFGQFQHVQ